MFKIFEVSWVGRSASYPDSVSIHHTRVMSSGERCVQFVKDQYKGQVLEVLGVRDDTGPDDKTVPWYPRWIGPLVS